jgi:hypothetical protein
VEYVKDDEMQRNIAIGKAFCLPSVVQRIVPDRSAIDGDENVFTFGSANKAHMIAKPAFKTATLVIIGTRTLALIVITTFEAVNVKITHICSDFFKVFYQFAI